MAKQESFWEKAKKAANDIKGAVSEEIVKAAGEKKAGDIKKDATVALEELKAKAKKGLDYVTAVGNEGKRAIDKKVNSLPVQTALGAAKGIYGAVKNSVQTAYQNKMNDLHGRAAQGDANAKNIIEMLTKGKDQATRVRDYMRSLATNLPTPTRTAQIIPAYKTLVDILATETANPAERAYSRDINGVTVEFSQSKEGKTMFNRKDSYLLQLKATEMRLESGLEQSVQIELKHTDAAPMPYAQMLEEIAVKAVHFVSDEIGTAVTYRSNGSWVFAPDASAPLEFQLSAEYNKGDLTMAFVPKTNAGMSVYITSKPIAPAQMQEPQGPGKA